MASRPLHGRAFTLFESQYFDDNVLQVAIAPAVSELIGGAGEGNGHRQEEHQRTSPNAQLSPEARALAQFLLKEMDFRFKVISTSINALKQSFKNHREQMEGKSMIISTSISALEESFKQHTENMNGKHVNNLLVTPPHDLQCDASEKEKLFNSNGASAETYGAREHCAQIVSPWLYHETECVPEDDNDLHSSAKPQQHRKHGNNVEHMMARASTAAGRGSGMFGSSATVEAKLDQDEYTVFEFYHESGWAQWIARSDAFSNMTFVAIFLNAIYIGYDIDNNSEENLLDADLQFQIMENMFCVFFSLEWLVRFCAFRLKCDCWNDTWFKLDTFLALMMVVETWIFPVAVSGGTGIPSGLIKLVRLLRIFRMTRLMRVLPELVAMIKGVKVASRAVGSALLMLVALVYVFGIILFTVLKNEEEEALVAHRFRKLGVTMWTLLIDGVFLDGIGILSRSLMDANQYIATCLLLLFVLLSALTVMNMLIGVLCEVVSQVASAEKEDIAIRMVKDNLLKLLKELDEDGSGELSRKELLLVLKLPDAIGTLESLHVDVHYLIEQLDMFFERESEIAFHRVLDMILMLRGDRPPTMKDLLHRETFNRWKMSKYFKKIMDRIERPVFHARASEGRGCN